MNIDVFGDTLVKYEKETSRLRIGGGSWTVQIGWLEGIEKIQYITAKATYTISKKKALEKGFGRLLGGEEKLVIPVKYWRIKQNET